NIELALCRETAQRIIIDVFHFYRSIGKLTADKEKKIRQKFLPVLTRKYYFTSCSQKELENYLRVIVSAVRNQKADDEHFADWTTNRSDHTALLFWQQEAG